MRVETAPGGLCFNRAAFSVPPSGQQGNLPHNGPRSIPTMAFKKKICLAGFWCCVRRLSAPALIWLTVVKVDMAFPCSRSSVSSCACGFDDTFGVGRLHRQRFAFDDCLATLNFPDTNVFSGHALTPPIEEAIRKLCNQLP